jgi:rubrerythrin
VVGTLNETHPLLLKEFHPTKNGEISLINLTAGSHKKIEWLCIKCTHQWNAPVYRRTSGGGCPACAGRAVHSDGRNSMRVTHPNLAEELHPTENGKLNPDNLIAGTHKKLLWRCINCSHEWHAKGTDRRQGKGCPSCAGHAVHIDERNSLAMMSPNLVREFHPTKNGSITPNQIVNGSGKRVHWICEKCSHEWLTRVSDRTGIKKTGCGYCNGPRGKTIHLHSDGRNTMANTHPNLADELHSTKNGNITPENIIAGTGKKLFWTCRTCDYEWQTTGNSRVSSGSGCPVCVGFVVHTDGRNSMEVMFPKLAKEFHPSKNGEITPRDIIAGTGGKKYHWICSNCSHEWEAVRNSGKHGCPACANIVLHKDGKNSLSHMRPDLAMEFHPSKNGKLTADDVVPGTGDKLWWICKTCNHEWKSTGAHRNNGRGCPACTKTGFQPHLPGQYYVHEIINSNTSDRLFFKAGISGDWKERLLQLKRGLPNNLIINNIEVIYFDIGRDALHLETRLKAIHEIRAPRRDFDGGDELFLINPLDYSREHNLLPNK